MAEDFPELPDSCQQALPILEKRSYSALIAELAEYLAPRRSESLDTDFALQEFLDKYGMRLGQLGTILKSGGPLAEASNKANRKRRLSEHRLRFSAKPQAKREASPKKSLNPP